MSDKTVTNSEIQNHIKSNCRNGHGEPMMDEQSFYEGAKWCRNKLQEYAEQENAELRERVKELESKVPRPKLHYGNKDGRLKKLH